MDKEEQVTAKLWKRINKRKLRDLEDGSLVLAFDVGQIHLAECVLLVDYSSRPPFHVKSWQMNNLGTTKTTDAVRALCVLSVTKPLWAEVNVVVIEQQKKINQTMVSMSFALQAVFNMLNPSAEVYFASSVHKFSVFVHMVGMGCIEAEDKRNSAYVNKTIRKKNAIRLTREMLNVMNREEPNIQLLEETAADQKDDLCDAFVYACGYIFKNEPFIK
jgi:hypothetical protein